MDEAPPWGGPPHDAEPPPPRDLAGLGIPGRTRPRFDELPPGPPTWPGWSILGLGLVALAVSALEFGFIQLERVPGSDAFLAALLGLGSFIAVFAGLIWLAVAGLLRRRRLNPERYRGPSVFVLLSIVVIGVTLFSAPLLVLTAGVDLGDLDSAGASAVQLLATPAGFLLVTATFVLGPGALAGVRLLDGWATPRNLAIGIVVGLVASYGAGLVLELMDILSRSLTGVGLNGAQAVGGVASGAPAWVAVLGLVVAAPIAEELFFRGMVLNAWEREYGTTRGLVGSALLFALLHLLGAPVFFVVPIFLLGLLLGYLYVRWRSLPMTIGVHAAFNLLSVIALLSQR